MYAAEPGVRVHRMDDVPLDSEWVLKTWRVVRVISLNAEYVTVRYMRDCTSQWLNQEATFTRAFLLRRGRRLT